MKKIENIISEDIQQELNQIIEKIKLAVVVKQIILFGSYAYGNPTRESDIDLCILTDDGRRKIEILWNIQREVYKVAKHSIDMLVYRPEDFAHRAISITTIEKTISNKGIIIYE